MIAIITILTAFPLGFFLSSRLAARTTYAIAYLWAFVFQSTYLMLDSLGGGAAPAFTTSDFPLGYGLVCLAIFTLGFGVVEVGHRVGRGRREHRASRPGATAGSRSTALPQNS